MQTVPVKSIPAASGSKAAHTGETMNTYPRQQPAPKKDQNSHIHTGLIAAQRCFDWLEAEGFHVLGLDVGAHAVPLILIQACAKCAWLARTYNGFAYKLFPVQGSRATMMRADTLGCRVEWVERGH